MSDLESASLGELIGILETTYGAPVSHLYKLSREELIDLINKLDEMPELQERSMRELRDILRKKGFTDSQVISRGYADLINTIYKLNKSQGIQQSYSRSRSPSRKNSSSHRNTEDLHSQLITASSEGNLNQVRSLVSRGANIHSRDNEALIQASDGGHCGVVDYLLGEGADPHCRKYEALKLAADNDDLDTLKELVKYLG